MQVHHLSVAARARNPEMHRTRDHKVPKARGGLKSADNIVTACLRCNTDKGTLTVEEYRLVLAHRRGLVPSCQGMYVFAGEGENRGRVGAPTETTSDLRSPA